MCILPVTHETRGILNAQTFATMPQGSALIHVGRGEHLIRDDIVESLNKNHLRAAILDVFIDEPLPLSDPYWNHPKIIVTPHMASVASSEAIGLQVAMNVRRLISGENLHNVVDVERGY